MTKKKKKLSAREGYIEIIKICCNIETPMNALNALGQSLSGIFKDLEFDQITRYNFYQFIEEDYIRKCIKPFKKESKNEYN